MENVDVFRVVRYCFLGALLIFLAFILSFVLVFRTLFVIDNMDASTVYTLNQVGDISGRGGQLVSIMSSEDGITCTGEGLTYNKSLKKLVLDGDLDVSGIMAGSLSLKFSTATISNGTITYSTYHMGIIGEGGANDDLDTISGGSEGSVVYIFPISSSSNIKLRHGTGNLNLNGSDRVMNNLGDIAIFRRNGSNWNLIFTNR